MLKLMVAELCIFMFIRMIRFLGNKLLLPTGSEVREVLGVESIPVAILPFCQYNDKYCIIIAQI